MVRPAFYKQHRAIARQLGETIADFVPGLYSLGTRHKIMRWPNSPWTDVYWVIFGGANSREKPSDIALTIVVLRSRASADHMDCVEKSWVEILMTL